MLAGRDIVVDIAALRVHSLAYPIRFAQRGDEEADALIESDVYPIRHLVEIFLRTLLDEGVEADRFVGQRAHQSNAFAQIMAMDESQ